MAEEVCSNGLWQWVQGSGLVSPSAGFPLRTNKTGNGIRYGKLFKLLSLLNVFPFISKWINLLCMLCAHDDSVTAKQFCDLIWQLWSYCPVKRLDNPVMMWFIINTFSYIQVRGKEAAHLGHLFIFILLTPPHFYIIKLPFNRAYRGPCPAVSCGRGQSVHPGVPGII